MKKLLRNKTITIKYSNLLIGEKTTVFTFSLESVSNKKLLDPHLKDFVNADRIKNHKFEVIIPNSLFKLSLSTKEIVLERWFYDKIKNTMFIDRNQAVLLKIWPIRFCRIVKLYLSKNY